MEIRRLADEPEVWTSTNEKTQRKQGGVDLQQPVKRLNFSWGKKMRHQKLNQIKTKQKLCFLCLESKGKIGFFIEVT